MIFPGVTSVLTSDGYKWKVGLDSLDDLQQLHEAVAKEGAGRLALEVRFLYEKDSDLDTAGSICIMDVEEF